MSASSAGMTENSREFDVVVFGATGFVGVLTAKYLAEHAPAGTRDRAGRPQRGQARADPRVAAGRRPRLAAHRGRLRLTRVARRDGGAHPRRLHDRRPLPQVRRVAAGRRRQRRHRLRRPHRRDPVRPLLHRQVRRPGGGHRCPHRARLRVRLDPVRRRRPPAARAGPRPTARASSPTPPRRHQDARRPVRRHVRLDAGHRRSRPAAGGAQGPDQPARALVRPGRGQARRSQGRAERCRDLQRHRRSIRR